MKLYQYLLNVSIITRWILFIVPMLGILWIPGILSLTAYPNANVSPNVLEDSEVTLNFIKKIWGVKLLWWSIWLTICWAGM